MEPKYSYLFMHAADDECARRQWSRTDIYQERAALPGVMDEIVRSFQTSHKNVPRFDHSTCVARFVQMIFLSYHPLTQYVAGFAPNASTGEFAHQQHKRSNPSSSGRNAPLHYISNANTDYAWMGLADGVSYNVMKRNWKSGRDEEVTVRPGRGCSRVLQALRKKQPGGLVGAPDTRAEGIPTKARVAGSHKGSAIWTAQLRRESDVEASVDGPSLPSWQELVSSGRFRPTPSQLLQAYKTTYGCGNTGGADGTACAEPRCPECWTHPNTLAHTSIECSRFNHFASLAASSGLGRWKGGDARSALSGCKEDGLSDEWVFGRKGGEDVEIWRTTPPVHDDPKKVDTGGLTIGRIVYFFEHEANDKMSGRISTPGPKTRWVLTFEYVSAGIGRGRLPDVATKHPTLRLRGNGPPAVFPVNNIRRHVHLYHMCGSNESHPGHVPADEGDAADPRAGCGVVPASDGSGALVWQHAFKLARRTPHAQHIRGEDKYIVNEHHHSISRDSFIN